MKKTKIICTIGPASEQEPVMLKLINNGMNVVRMNFSHGKFDDGVENEQAFRIKTTREINEKYGTNIALLLDTKGPEIRTGKFDDNNGKDKILIEKGSIVRVAMKDCLGNKDKFSVSYPGLYDDMNVGDYVLVDDGYLTLEVIEKDAANRELVTKALNSHKVKSKRGINIPGVKLNMPFISDEDRHDLVVAAAGQQLDFVAASFTRRASDVNEMRKLLSDNGNDHIQIIAKIENQEGVDNLEEIMDAADGIMVARGDLGIEIPAWEVPVIQKRIVRECQKKGKICVVATQMLESMQNNPRPTRAEVSDVANAVLDGADATMLSGETTGGDYPIEAVEYMGKINNRMSTEIDYERLFDNAVKEHSDNDFQRAFAMDAAKMALEYKEAIAIITIGGKEVAKEVSRFRPIVPIIALLQDRQDARSLAMNFGIYPVMGGEKEAIAYIKENFDTVKGKVAIVVDKGSLKVIEL